MSFSRTMYKVLFSPLSELDGFELISAHLDPDMQVEFANKIPTDASYHALVSAKVTRDHLLASPNLERLIVPYSGPSPNLVRLLADFPHISLHQLPYDTPAIAEVALALMLSTSKFVIPADQQLRKGDWSLRYSEQPQMLLKGRRVLLLGYGRVGSYLANILNVMGMDVLAIRRHLDKGAAVDPNAKIYGFDALHRLLPKSDIVICTLPGTLETQGWIGAKEIGLLPAHALVINVGDAQVFDEAALFVALRSKHIAGAGLDAWYEYPESEEGRSQKHPSRFPYGTLDNVVMSPNRAGRLGVVDGGRVQLLASMLNKAYRKEPVPYQVDVELGY